MSIFDRLKQDPQQDPQNSPEAPLSPAEEWKRWGMQRFTFEVLPESLPAFAALPEAALINPFQTAALTVAALCIYAADQTIGEDVINFLKGPRTMSGYDRQFLRDRLRGKSYLPFSFFEGAEPGNNYTPTRPFTVTVTAQEHSFTQEGQAQLFIRSGGADSPRPVTLRRFDGRWYLWDEMLTSDIRKPANEDVWR